MIDRLMLPMSNVCVACLREGIVDDPDAVDGAMIFGTGYAPFRGGPLNYARRAGRGECRSVHVARAGGEIRRALRARRGLGEFQVTRRKPRPQPETTGPSGDLCIRTLAMPADTNANGDIFGGWLLSQMDVGGGVFASKVAKSRTVTVAIDAMNFRKAVYVGDLVSVYANLVRVGRTSVTVHLEAWVLRRGAAVDPGDRRQFHLCLDRRAGSSASDPKSDRRSRRNRARHSVPSHENLHGQRNAALASQRAAALPTSSLKRMRSRRTQVLVEFGWKRPICPQEPLGKVVVICPH